MAEDREPSPIIVVGGSEAGTVWHVQALVRGAAEQLVQVSLTPDQADHLALELGRMAALCRASAEYKKRVQAPTLRQAQGERINERAETR